MTISTNPVYVHSSAPWPSTNINKCKDLFKARPCHPLHSIRIQRKNLFICLLVFLFFQEKSIFRRHHRGKEKYMIYLLTCEVFSFFLLLFISPFSTQSLQYARCISSYILKIPIYFPTVSNKRGERLQLRNQHQHTLRTLNPYFPATDLHLQFLITNNLYPKFLIRHTMSPQITTVSRRKSFRYLSLPPEIRNQTYCHLLCF